MPAGQTTIETLIAEQQQRPVPEAVPREVRLPRVPGKADALVGMEIDFAIDDPVRGGAPALVQVCETLTDPATRRREIGALAEAMAELGSASGTVVTLTEEETIETGAGEIRVLPAREWFFRLAPSAPFAWQPPGEAVSER